MELITGALAAFYVWNTLRFLLPFSVPDRLALPLYGGIAYGLLQVPVHSVVLALAIAGGLTLLMLGVSLLGVRPERWSLPTFHRPGHFKLTGLGHTPGAKASRVGRRIPKL